MAYAFIHGEVKGSGASVEFKGNGLDLLDLTIQIVGSVVAEVPEPLRPYVIKKIQDKILLMQCRTIWKRRERRLRQRRRKSLLLARR